MSRPVLPLPSAGQVQIRAALPGEVGTLREIDDDASALYASHGLSLELGPSHPFVRDEVARWRRCIERGAALLAVDAAGRGVGFAALSSVDGAPYLDQLSVRRAAMRRGVGAALLAHSLEWARAAGGTAIWLTTYDELPFNRPYYERRGFCVVPEAECGPRLRAHLTQQRRYLPVPPARVVMRRGLGGER